MSLGPDGRHAKVLKEVASENVEILFMIFQESLVRNVLEVQ